MTASKTTTDDLEEHKPKAVKALRHTGFKYTWSGAIEAGRPRVGCLSIAQDNSSAVLCLRTRYGDVEFHRAELDEWCNGPLEYLQRMEQCGPRRMNDYSQLWLLDVSDFDDWHAVKRKELLAFLAEKYRNEDVHTVALPVLEAAFERSVERIAKLARKGAFGNPRDRTLSNLDGLALGMSVFATQMAEGA